MGSVQFEIVPCFCLHFFSRSIGPFQCLVNTNDRVLICCICCFQSGSLFIILAYSVCKSFQCLIFTLTQGGESGHLFRLICSAVLWGRKNTAKKKKKKKNHCHVWVVLTVYGSHWVCPRSQHVCFPSLHCSGSRLLFRGTVQSGHWVSCTSQV